MSDQGDDKRGWTIPVVTGASLVWLVLCCLLFIAAAPCNEAGLAFWDQKVSCLTPNEMGDFFAGAFAPMAFAWLIAAVSMQCSELREQRQELTYTRKEYALTRLEVEAQRKALEEQVVETRRNVEFIAEQTAILQEERRRQVVAAVDDRIDTLIEIVGKRLNTEFSRLLSYTYSMKDGGQWYDAIGTKISKAESYDLVKESISSLRESKEEFVNLASTRDIEVFADAYVVASTVTAVNEIDELSGKASFQKNDQLEFCNFWHLERLLGDVVSILSDADAEWKLAYEEHLANLTA